MGAVFALFAAFYYFNYSFIKGKFIIKEFGELEEETYPEELGVTHFWILLLE